MIKITQSTATSASKYLMSEFDKIIDENKNSINNIVTNGNICYILQIGLGYEPYTLEGRLTKEMRLYSVGNYKSLEQNIDVLQRWDDSKIYLKKDDEIIEIIEIEDENDILILK